MSALRVLIVDDQELVRAGLKMIVDVEDDLEVVWEAADGAEAVRRCEQLRPDVVLMDVQMPGVDGLQATAQITAAGHAAVLVLTTFDRDDYLFEALHAGASGFLLKNAAPEELVEAVRVVARGDALLAPQLTRRVIERFASRPGGARRPHLLERLTDREHDVLVRLARGASNAEIAAELVLGEATVKTHVSRVLGKLDLRDRAQAVVYTYETGVVCPGEPTDAPASPSSRDATGR